MKLAKRQTEIEVWRFYFVLLYFRAIMDIWKNTIKKYCG